MLGPCFCYAGLSVPLISEVQLFTLLVVFLSCGRYSDGAMGLSAMSYSGIPWSIQLLFAANMGTLYRLVSAKI